MKLIVKYILIVQLIGIVGLFHSAEVKAQFPAYSSINDLLPEQAFAIHGTADSGAFGFGASGIGDFNNDGFDDIILGARTSDNAAENSGSCYVVFGSGSTLPLNFEVSQLDGNNGFVVHGVDAGDFAGWSVGGAGDVNNDGIDDLIIGAKGANPSSSATGAAYVIYGTIDPMPAALNLSFLDGNNGFRINGASSFDEFGNAVAGTGDVNNDGIDDLIIGANMSDNSGLSSGAVYVVLGRPVFPASINAADLNGSDGFLINAPMSEVRLGLAVSKAGDFNGDGLADMLMGAYYSSPNGVNLAGTAYVVFGRDTVGSSTDFPAVVSLSDLNSSTGVVFHGSNELDTFGRNLTHTGDINNDGIDDIAIHASGDDTNGNNSGAVYLIYGTTTPFITAFNVNDLDGDNGFVMYGESSDDSTGESLAYAGDFNGDGIDDLIAGAPDADTPVTNAGSVYLLYGWNLPFPAAFDIDNVSNDNGFIIEGNDNWDQTGSALGTAGDFNGDGISDLIVAASGNDFNGESNGTVWVIFGSTDIIFKNSFDH